MATSTVPERNQGCHACQMELSATTCSKVPKGTKCELSAPLLPLALQLFILTVYLHPQCELVRPGD